MIIAINIKCEVSVQLYCKLLSKLMKSPVQSRFCTIPLKSDCPTRQSSTQLMIDRVLEQKEAISKYCEEIATRHLCLKWQKIDVLESVKSAFG